MNLKELQNDLVTAFFGGDINVDKYIVSDDVLSAKQRFNIYKGSVHGILTQALSDIYPVCKQLVGDKFFDHVTQKFITQYPPQSAFFANFGGEFSDFLRDFEAAKAVEYLADTAQLEWQRHKAWNGKNQAASDFTTLQTYSEDQQLSMSFALAGTASLVKAEYRSDLLWEAHQENSTIDLNEIDIFQHLKVLVWRIDYTMMMNELTELQFDFLTAVQRENTLSQLAEQFTETLPELLSTALQRGWIRSFSLAKTI